MSLRAVLGGLSDDSVPPTTRVEQKWADQGFAENFIALLDLDIMPMTRSTSFFLQHCRMFLFLGKDIQRNTGFLRDETPSVFF